jgi:DNA-binding transcriptional MerR regulator
LPNKQYTLDELVTRTGFGKRQIRYYITEKLIPGAGDHRGPNAVYGEETLHRLETIAILKNQPVGPTGRTMTLAEIRHALDNQPEPNLPAKMNSLVFQERQDLSMMSDEAPKTRASTYLANLKGINHCIDEPAMDQPQAYFSHSIQECSASEIPPVDKPPLENLMQSLHSLLTELGSDTRFDTQVGEGKSWRRITSPDVEIQVRTPDTTEARLRLYRMAAQLGRLLARED